MKYGKFEDLPVWQAAIQLGRQVYALTAEAAFKGRHSLCDQIERAAVAVSNNIAEGFERGTNQELLTFLYLARGAAGEVRSMLHLLSGMQAFRNLEPEMQSLREQTESISKRLGAWARALQDSDVKGRRYVTEKARLVADRARGREEFLKHLEELRTAHRRELELKRTGKEGGKAEMAAGKTESETKE